MNDESPIDLGVLDFEKPIVELENKLRELRAVSADSDIGISDEIERLEENARELATKIFSNLNDWQIAQLARHQKRPHALDFISAVFEDVHELHGDRMYADDPAIVTGVARLNGEAIVFMGHQKGRTTKEKVLRNFGMPKPEGYRKALRMMRLAERMRLPIVSFVDTPGAYPGIGAEERGQSEAIAHNLMVLSHLPVPIIVTVIGEGGSGGALAIGVGDHVAMLQYATYSVISPEGCASILWKDSERAPDAATAMGVTANKLFELGLIDHVIEEPLGGAHRDMHACTQSVGEHLEMVVAELAERPVSELLDQRLQRIAAYGRFSAD